MSQTNNAFIQKQTMPLSKNKYFEFARILLRIPDNNDVFVN